MDEPRFLVDACVDIRLSWWLNKQGYDAWHMRDEGLQSLPDDQVFAKAIQEGRILVTHDLGFGEISAFVRGHKVGIVVFRLHNPRWQRLTDRLAVVLPDSLTALQGGAVVIVEDSRYRIRPLPLTKANPDSA